MRLIATFTLSVTKCEILTVKMCMTLTMTFSPLEWAMVKCKYVNQKAACDFLYVGNSNVCHGCSICHQLRDISSQKCA